jgi:hypothetical protein
LYDYAYVDPSYVAPDLGDFFGRVTRVEHRITPEKWLLHIGFSKLDAVAAPQITPSPGNAATTDGTWIALTLLNSWVNYGGAHLPARYMRRDGIVYVQGLVKNGTLNTHIATMPVGYRAGYDVVSQQTQGTGGAARIDVLQNGNIYPYGVSNNGYVSINFVYPAEA